MHLSSSTLRHGHASLVSNPSPAVPIRIIRNSLHAMLEWILRLGPLRARVHNSPPPLCAMDLGYCHSGNLDAHITRTRTRSHLKQPERTGVARLPAHDITSHETHVQSHLASPNSRTPCTPNSRYAPPGVCAALASGVVPRATDPFPVSQEYHRPGSTAAARRARCPYIKPCPQLTEQVPPLSMSLSSPCHAPQPSTPPTIAAHGIQHPRYDGTQHHRHVQCPPHPVRAK
ncbi:hypothetical protein B0H13DRAFT_2377562 [Mycena leptocephala]|nr:hypothetical protein B0H13DRAFT_2377562 [Mycena leptocephala]